MASSPLFVISEGEDFEVVQASRQEKAKRVSVLKIDGTSGKPSFALSPAGLVNLDSWTKDAVDGAAATATAEHIILRAAGAMQVSAINYLPDAALAASDTNYATLTVTRRNADGTAAVVVASINTALTVVPFSGNWLQWVAVPLTLTAANLVLSAGQILTVAIVKVGTGVVVPAGALQVEYVQN